MGSNYFLNDTHWLHPTCDPRGMLEGGPCVNGTMASPSLVHVFTILYHTQYIKISVFVVNDLQLFFVKLLFRFWCIFIVGFSQCQWQSLILSREKKWCDSFCINNIFVIGRRLCITIFADEWWRVDFFCRQTWAKWFCRPQFLHVFRKLGKNLVGDCHYSICTTVHRLSVFAAFRSQLVCCILAR